MKFNVSQLMQEPIGSVRNYDLIEDISTLDPELAPLGPLVGQIQFLRTHSGILVIGEVSTPLQVTCNRCLSPIVTPVRFEIEESFRPLTEVQTGRFIHPDDFEGTRADLEDEALLIDQHHLLNLAEIVRQNLWLAAPMVPGCNWEGTGECPNLTRYLQEVEGLDREVKSSSEQSEEQVIDPRWEALLSLGSDSSEEDSQ